jgi:hypothetical protein
VILDFGKYRGCDLESVPTPYKKWLLRSSRELVSALEEDLGDFEDGQERFNSCVDSFPVGTREILEAGYRSLLKQHDPDLRGRNEDAVNLNLVMERLRRMVAT